MAVSKTFSESSIIPLIESGHTHFGENKIQEASLKWTAIKKKYNNIKLHMVGNLQSNKSKKAVGLFDYIHSLDNYKLAEKIKKFELELNKRVKIFIQVNLSEENQKTGILKKDLNRFYFFCKEKLLLDVIGLMCLPPQREDPTKYFITLKKLSNTLDLKHLSMGMSEDYLQAIKYGASFLRLGTSIFGERKN